MVLQKTEHRECSNGLNRCTYSMNVGIVSRAAARECPNLLGREGVREPEAAFVLLVDRQSRFVFQVAYAITRIVEDAEDVVQDTFLKLFRTGAWKEMRHEKPF